MVGLVIVSHSRALAEALVGLLHQVSSADLPVAVAAGIGEDRTEFGTDAVEIMDAIQSVYSEDGVLVLMDLGSAVLSAKMALEFLPPEMAEKVQFCGAPVVEGAIAAAVQIGLGSSLDDICREANMALAPKREQLGQEENASSVPLPVSDESAESITLTLTNLHGLHARPAAKFVQTVARFAANVTVNDLTNGKGPVSARSLNAIATLGAIENHQICIRASGEEARLVLAALKALVEDNFGEAPAASAALEKPVEVYETVTVSGAIKAVPISDGYALAPLYKYQAQRPPIPTHPSENPEVEWTRLQAALESTSREVTQLARRMKQSIGSNEGAIFDAHLLILQDPDLIQAARKGIDERHENAAFAWNAAITAAAESYRALDDPYLQQRAADVEDVGAQVLFAMMNHKTNGPIAFEQPVILYAADLTPTETSQLDMDKVLGIITAGGGPTSHSAILSRALGIPAVAGVGRTLDRQPGGTLAALNGFTGEILLDPSEEIQADIRARRAEWLAGREKLLQTSQQLAMTKDGQRVEVFANIGGVNDARAAVQNGAEGVGLLRTEFLFLTRETAPTEEEQYRILREIYETMGERPITVRTLDVGGDKELPYIQLPEEPNPFLGVRALRLSLARPDLFVTQLRAILRAADGYPCRIMFPMVADVDEVRQARQYIEKAHNELTTEGKSHAWPVELGIMVEIPSAALLAPILANEVDFFSIGTNDLTQYTLAAERGNPALSHLADGLHPAVLRLIGGVAQASHALGKWTGICGELGGDPEATRILVGLGVDELSLNPAGIPHIKSILRDLTMENARALAQQALQCQTSDEVRQLVRKAG